MLEKVRLYTPLQYPLAFTRYHYSRTAEAIRKIGFRDILDMHSPFEPSIGFNKMQYTIDSTGRRHSSFRAYLPADLVAARPNLHVCINVLATILEFSESDDGTTNAEGVGLETVDGRLNRVITARREIVLSCGTLRTPQLLLLRFVLLCSTREGMLTPPSGIGPAAHLRERGIRVVRDTPGVGQNLVSIILRIRRQK